jgi:hypothetical protein
MSDRLARTLEVADRARALLATKGASCAVIGAAALAAHGYARATSDLDLGTATDPFTTLRWLTDALKKEGLAAALTTPDADDPLGGVVTIRGDDFDQVQIVNFVNPLGASRNPGPEAIESAGLAIEGTTLKVVALAHLIALKLYAGGLKSRVDVIELLRRNPAADLREIRAVCARHALAAELDQVLAEVARARGPS